MNLGELRTELIDLVARTDYTAAKANTHINRAVNRLARVAELPNQEKVVQTLMPAALAIDIPSDFISLKHLLIGTAPCERMDFERIIKMSEVVPTNPTTIRYFARLADTWIFRPAAEGETITVVYHAPWDTLVDDTDTNLISIQAPDAILYGAASIAGIFFRDERQGQWESIYQALAEDLQTQQRNAELSTSTAQTIDPVISQDGYYGGY